MRIGLIGDIHGNSQALKAVLNSISAHKIDQLLVTGDLIGYYFEPKKVIELLSDWRCIYVKGNHEEMLKRCLVSPEELSLVDSKYGSGLRIAIQTLSQTQLIEIEKMPLNVSLNFGNCKILLCHGSPKNTKAYLYPDATKSALAEYESLDHDFVIFGNTHYPMDIKTGSVRLVNPGSVGQPRTKSKAASWAILDTNTSQVTFKSEKYDASLLVKECYRRHPEIPYLAEVLQEKK